MMPVKTTLLTGHHTDYSGNRSRCNGYTRVCNVECWILDADRTLLRALAALYRVPWDKILDMERLWLALSLSTASSSATSPCALGAGDAAQQQHHVAASSSSSVSVSPQGLGGSDARAIASGSGSGLRNRRALTIGLATVGGGAALALTGGLAAPAVAAVFGVVGSTVDPYHACM